MGINELRDRLGWEHQFPRESGRHRATANRRPNVVWIIGVRGGQR